MKDLIIIGAGPAGLAAAIYGQRAGLDLALIERYTPGGQVMNTYEVENYPGFTDPVAGFELISAMEAQARRFGTEVISCDVTSYEKNAQGNFVIHGSAGETYESRTLILAMGSSYKHLGVPGEVEYIGKGVSYCATCDGPFYKGKVTALVGGGNTALEEALFLTRFSSKVYLIHRRDSFRAEKLLSDRVAQNDKIELVLDTVVDQVIGDAKVNSLALRNVRSGEKRVLPVDGFFVFVGYDPNNSIVQKDILDGWGQILVNIDMCTAIPGLFAAGDIRTSSRRQIVMACADGATAAMGAYEYLNR
ncbi:MAG TPA: thioredoxin-disulfide reductase [Spirochaetota bacterium]